MCFLKLGGIEWIDVDSMYNGRCRQFKHKEKLATASYLNFVAKDGPDNPIDIFFLLEGKIFYLYQKIICVQNDNKLNKFSF